MTKQLQSKLKVYSALVTAGVVSSTNTDASIVYTSVNHVGSGQESYNVDIDGNGTTDYQLMSGSWGACYGFQGRMLNIIANGSNNIIYGGFTPQDLSSGYMVSSGKSFGVYGYVWGGCATFAIGGKSNGLYIAGTSYSSAGWGSQFLGQTKFIGVQFKSNSDTHYGWLRLTLASDLSTWTLVDMAYDCVPNSGIITGGVAGGAVDNVAPVPKTGSLSAVNSCNPINSVGDLTAPTATDKCVGQITGTTNASFPITSSTTITWTYDDGNGNTSTQNQNIVIPVINAGVTTTGMTMSSDETDGSATYQWIDCDNGNAAITDETNKDYTPIANGNYAVEVTLGGCTVTSSCVAFTGFVGLSNIDKQITNVHPNPATEEIIINLAEVGANTTMTIVDVTGKVVKEINVTNNKTVINLTDLNSGIYLVKISSDQRMNTVKFVKK